MSSLPPGTLAITGLDDKLCGKDVGKLGTVAIAPTGHLECYEDVSTYCTGVQDASGGVAAARQPRLNKCMCMRYIFPLTHMPRTHRNTYTVTHSVLRCRHQRRRCDHATPTHADILDPYLLLVIVVVTAGEQVAKDKLRHIDIFLLVHLDRHSVTVVQHGDSVAGLHGNVFTLTLMGP